MTRRAWNWIPILLLALGIVACGDAADDGAAGQEAAETASATQETDATDPADAFARAIEEAHGREAWVSKQAISARIELVFGDNPALAGRMIFTPSMSKVRLETGEAAVVWDGDDAWLTPADAELPRARFHVLTWPYFLAAPMKLRDPGTTLELLGEKTLQGETYSAARLTFDEGVGDSPDDWYLIYRDEETSRLAAMAYIVTYGTTAEEANQEPHAISYHDFQDVDAVFVPTLWKFWQWSEEEGIHGEPIGRATLSDVRFVTPEPGAFEVPEDDALPATLPEAGAAS